MKKKREKCVTPENARLKIPAGFAVGDGGIQRMVERLRDTECFEVQQKIITKLSTYLKNANSEDNKRLIFKLITYAFLTVNPKLPIRKTLVRVLGGLESRQIEICLAEHLKTLVENVKATDGHKTHNDVCSYVLACTENFPPGLRAVSSVAGALFTFTVGFLRQLVQFVMTDELSTVQIKQDTFTFIHNTSRVLLFIVQKCSVDKHLSEVSVDVIKNCWYILNTNEIGFDTKKNCGLIIVYSFKFLPAEITEKFDFAKNPAIELVASSLDNEHCIESLDIANYSNDHTVKLAVYCGILNIIPKNVLSSECLNEKPVVACIFEGIIVCLKQTTSISALILEVSHALTLLAKSLDKLPLETLKPLFDDGLNYVWTHLEHYMDTVRHMTKAVFKNFIQLAKQHKQLENDRFLRKIFDDINQMPFNSATRYIALHILAAEISCSSLLLNMKLLLPQQMLENIKDPTLAPQICSLYEFLMEKHFAELTPQYEDVWILQWVKIILPYINLDEPKSTITCYQRLVVAAFKINCNVIKIVLPFQHKSTPTEFCTLVGCLRLARKEGIKVDLSDCTSTLIEHNTLEANVHLLEDEIRLSILGLVVERHKSTELFTGNELTYLKKFLYYNLSAQLASTRKEMVHLYKRAFTRISDGMAVLTRAIKHEEKAKQEMKCPVQLQYNLDFMNKAFNALTVADTACVGAVRNKTIYVNFLNLILRECLLSGLLNDAHYHRRSVCLELLVFFHEIFKEKLWIHWWFDDDLVNLKNVVIFDTYETNKQMAVRLYKIIVPQKDPKSKEEALQELKYALTLASDLKPCSTTAAAYMFEIFLISPFALDAIHEFAPNTKENSSGNALPDLIFFLFKELERKLRNKDNKCLQVDKYFCTYGVVFSIRHLLQKVNLLMHPQFWQILLGDLTNICFRIHERVGPVVTSPSPEGHLPDDCEVLDNSDNIDETTRAQALLVFAWRNVKEIALLLGDISARVIACENEVALLGDDLLGQIGEFFIELFVRTKHRGVFEQAYLGFYKLCDAFWRSNNLKVKELPEFWLNKMLNVLSGNIDETCDSLCATRRSAGLPFLILAVLVTEPVPRANKSFHQCIKTLLSAASDVSEENVERRTHSMNVLRAVYRHNQLGELVSQYAAAGMIAAITGLKSAAWGVRNSSTLLFSALVTRMFGVQRTRDSDSDALSTKNKMTVKVFFMRYPELHQFLLDELSEGCDSSTSLTIYAVLLILSRLYPSHLDDKAVNLQEYLPLLNKCLSHSVFRTRELAARASIPFIPHSDYVKHIVKLIVLLSNQKLSNNELHGLLLQLLHLLKKYEGEPFKIKCWKLCEATFWILHSTGKQINHLTGALYLEVLVLLATLDSKTEDRTRLIQFVHKTDVQRSLFNTRDFLINLHYAKIYLTAKLSIDQNVIAMGVANEIRQNLHNENAFIRAFYLNLIVYLNFDKTGYTKDCLYITEEREIAEKPYTLAQVFTDECKKSLLQCLHSVLKHVFVVNFHGFVQSEECRLPALLVLRYYPCIVGELCAVEQMLEFFLELGICDSEEYVCGVIGCVDMVLRRCDYEILKRMRFGRFLEFLFEAVTSPMSAVHIRLATCHLLLFNKHLYISPEIYDNTQDFCCIWDIILILLEDSDPLVRNAISKLKTKVDPKIKVLAKVGINTVPERAREELLMAFRTMLPVVDATAFFIKWSLRHKPDYTENDQAVVFSSGSSGSLPETTPVTKAVVRILKHLLWSLEEGLSYEDKSIFIEEKATVVTWTLINAINRPTPMVAQSTRNVLLRILKSIMQFLETCRINRPTFKAEFTQIMATEQNNDYLKDVNKTDLYNLRTFLWTVYSPLIHY